MIVKVGVPTMTITELMEILAELRSEWDMDGLDIRIRYDGGLAMLRTIEVVDGHSDFSDGRDPHSIVVFNTEFYG